VKLLNIGSDTRTTNEEANKPCLTTFSSRKMVAPARAAEKLAAVSIDEEKNTQVEKAAKKSAAVSIDLEKNTLTEIPRYDPKDKSKLWISKPEIHHNSMMAKIRGLVQEKLLEQVANNDKFFAGIEDMEIELDEDDSEKKPETEEEILLVKKAQLLQDMLGAIMELPKDEILNYLTTSSLPQGFGGQAAQSNSKQSFPRDEKTLEAFENEAAHVDDNESTSSIDEAAITSNRVRASLTRAIGNKKEWKNPNEEDEEEDEYDAYNWLLDCKDAWKDLPAVVRINAMEVGYTETLWDEDAQDLPIFRELWKDLTPTQQTAAIFLANYDEQIWNDEVRILLLGEENPVLDSIREESSSNEEDHVSDTRAVVTKRDLDENDEEDAIMDEFLSNFVESTGQNDSSGSSKESKKESSINNNLVTDDEEEDDDDAMMDESLSNFSAASSSDDSSESDDSSDDDLSESDDSSDDSSVESTEEDKPSSGSIETKEESFINNSNGVTEEDESEAMMDEFLSNFVEPAAKEINAEEEDESEAMMDEFLSNFVEPADEDKPSSGSKETKEESSINNSNGITGEEDESEAMMDEFLSNFVEPVANKMNTESGSEEVAKEESSINNSNGVTEEEDESEAMMDEFLSNFVEPAGKEMNTESGSEVVAKEPEKESMADRSSIITNEGNEDAIMSEIVPTLVESTEEKDNKFKRQTTESSISTIPNDQEDEEQPLISEPRETTMDRGVHGENSPLLPSKEKKEDPEPPPTSTWETITSYLYWVPVVVGLPVAYKVATGSLAMCGLTST